MNEKKSDVKTKEKKGLFAKLKSVKHIEIIAVALLGVIVIVIMLSSFNFGDSNGSDSGSFSSSEYVSSLEKKLTDILSNVNGAGKVKVMLTVESGMETVTAVETIVKQSGNDTTTTTSPVMVGGKPVVLKEMYPKITGVLIVAQGASSIKVKLELLKATSSVLAIEENIIEIFTMK